jgi:hypothetical protein
MAVSWEPSSLDSCLRKGSPISVKALFSCARLTFSIAILLSEFSIFVPKDGHSLSARPRSQANIPKERGGLLGIRARLTGGIKNHLGQNPDIRGAAGQAQLIQEPRRCHELAIGAGLRWGFFGL